MDLPLFVHLEFPLANADSGCSTLRDGSFRILILILSRQVKQRVQGSILISKSSSAYLYMTSSQYSTDKTMKIFGDWL